MKWIILPLLFAISCSGGSKKSGNGGTPAIITNGGNTGSIPFDQEKLGKLDVSGATSLFYLGPIGGPMSQLSIPSTGLYKVLADGSFATVVATSKSGESMNTSDMQITQLFYPDPRIIVITLSYSENDAVYSQTLIVTRETGNVTRVPYSSIQLTTLVGDSKADEWPIKYWGVKHVEGDRLVLYKFEFTGDDWTGTPVYPLGANETLNTFVVDKNDTVYLTYRAVGTFNDSMLKVSADGTKTVPSIGKTLGLADDGALLSYGWQNGSSDKGQLYREESQLIANYNSQATYVIYPNAVTRPDSLTIGVRIDNAGFQSLASGISFQAMIDAGTSSSNYSAKGSFAKNFAVIQGRDASWNILESTGPGWGALNISPVLPVRLQVDNMSARCRGSYYSSGSTPGDLAEGFALFSRTDLTTGALMYYPLSSSAMRFACVEGGVFITTLDHKLYKLNDTTDTVTEIQLDPNLIPYTVSEVADGKFLITGRQKNDPRSFIGKISSDGVVSDITLTGEIGAGFNRF
ncbi:MAG: hypothetical protein EOP04_03805 [Proteobacteria bacterium]|nr:MAG: hypothetical protein EOP04_03805 [Pseudomonadota bacterium]